MREIGLNIEIDDTNDVPEKKDISDDKLQTAMDSVCKQWLDSQTMNLKNTWETLTPRKDAGIMKGDNDGDSERSETSTLNSNSGRLIRNAARKTTYVESGPSGDESDTSFTRAQPSTFIKCPISTGDCCTE